MGKDLFAYLFRSNGQVSEMPTDELSIALDQLMPDGNAQGQGAPSDSVAVYEFLQELKRTMRRSKLPVEVGPYTLDEEKNDPAYLSLWSARN